MKDFLTAPKEDLKRAILFPADEESPKFVWVRCFWNSSGRYEMPGTSEFLGADDVGASVVLQQNVLRGRALQHTLVVVSRDEFMSDGSLKNKSIAKATNGLVAYDWRGPVIALAKKGT